MTDRPVVSPSVLAWRQLRRHRVAVASAVVFAVLTVLCMAAPLIAPYEFDAIDLTSIREGPSWSHWMGTDDLMKTSFRLDGDQLASFRAYAGDGVFRVSIGLEDAEDLCADLDRVLG